MGTEEPPVESSGGDGLQIPGPLSTSSPGVGVAWPGTSCFCLSLFLFGLHKSPVRVEGQPESSRIPPHGLPANVCTAIPRSPVLCTSNALYSSFSFTKIGCAQSLFVSKGCVATPLYLSCHQHGGVWWLHSELFCRMEKAQHQSWDQAVCLSALGPCAGSLH